MSPHSAAASEPAAAQPALPELGPADLPRRGAVLALDYGERRIGVAVGELEVGHAHPLATLHAASDGERLAALEGLVKEWSPVLFVVGLPRHLDGGDHPLAPRCRGFAAKLSARFGRPARLVDERLTSATASMALTQAGVRGRRQKLLLDRMAAQQILEAFLAHPDAAA